MAYRIESVEVVAVTTTAKDVNVHCRKFKIENLTADQKAYIKEKSVDGVKASSSNGFAIPCGIFDEVLTADTLSIVGSASCDVRILYLREE